MHAITCTCTYTDIHPHTLVHTCTHLQAIVNLSIQTTPPRQRSCMCAHNGMHAHICRPLLSLSMQTTSPRRHTLATHAHTCTLPGHRNIEEIQCEHFQAIVKPQYVDHIPKAVRGNVREVLETKDQRQVKDQLLRELDLEQVRSGGIKILYFVAL